MLIVTGVPDVQVYENVGTPYWPEARQPAPAKLHQNMGSCLLVLVLCVWPCCCCQFEYRSDHVISSLGLDFIGTQYADLPPPPEQSSLQPC